MSSVYGRLFKYRGRERRSPLEDFLSEAIADLFNRMSMEQLSELIGELFVPPALLPHWQSLVARSKRIRMETQYPIKSGRIDLVVTVDEHPTIAIENKVGAPISERSQDDDQLTRYGFWIKSKKREGSPAIVCLLTHLTQPNTDFYRERNGGASPHVAKWSGVANALRRLSKNSQLSSEIRTLCAELNIFLAEKGMAGEFAGRDEFAAAVVYLRAGERMDHTFLTIYAHLKSLNGVFTSGASAQEMSLEYATKDSLIWGWKYLIHPSLFGLFFAYGIALDPAGTFKNAETPIHDSVFICIGAEDKKSIASLRASQDILQKPWMYAELSNWSAVISFKPLHEFIVEPERFSQRMIEWIDSEAAYVNAFAGSLA